ncbi:hypothetical protein QTP70_021663 [Hemibagrus guttatus]|uniref:Dynein regulatory complex protein 9 n=1 Tax=Hemibagrus guttatus TaxID=175788 RepID=A0AAE0RBE7_9TELE|nr:hypothetical protein QTP70_021663 [Hemibagrus guttatus]KAK3570617.1 hypothetical protein QTP86_023811 [Hemibagrus guttatus]
MSCTLSAVAVLRVCAVLRDCADQLAVLGNVMSGTHRDTTAAATVISENMRTLLQENRGAQLHLKETREGQAEDSTVSEAVHQLHRTQRELEQMMMMGCPISSDYSTKVQSDRKFAARLIGDLLMELKEEGTFSSLIHTVEEEKRREAQLQEMIHREEEDRLRIRTLKKHLLEFRGETRLQIQERDKMAAHLEDQLQERKMKKSLQENYMKNSTQLLVYQGQKLNSHIEGQLAAEIEASMLKKKLTEEEKSHKELEAFLKNDQVSLEKKLDYWMERYDKDTEDKQQELKTVKTNKSNNLAQLHEGATKYRDYEQVIIEDRLEKEKLRKQLEREQLQRKAAIKIQSWWRGTLVRKGLGPFKKAKKPKQKKESKKGKKK